MKDCMFSNTLIAMVFLFEIYLASSFNMLYRECSFTLTPRYRVYLGWGVTIWYQSIRFWAKVMHCR